MDPAQAMTLKAVVQVGCECFILWSAGGSVFYFVKGALRSSSIAGGVEEASTNWPGLRRWAAWFGALGAIKGGLLRLCRVRGPLSWAVAWGGANAVFSVHGGARAAVCEGLKGTAYSQAAGLAAGCLLLLVDPRDSSSQQEPQDRSTQQEPQDSSSQQ